MWCEVERVHGPNGETQAVIEAWLQAHAPSTEEVGQISTHPHAQVRRMGSESVLQAPFAQIRIIAKTDACRGALGRWTGVTAPESDWERRLGRWAITNGLVVHGHRGLALDPDGETPQGRWSAEEGAFWAEMAGRKTNGQTRGATWRGVRTGRPMHIKRWTRRDRGGHDQIVLCRASELERTIAESAWGFESEAIATEQLGRWLWRFAAVRSSATMEVHGVEVETARRGIPEGGGMASLGLTLALRKAAGRPEGVWRYDAIAHAVEKIHEDTAAFFTHGRETLDPRVESPTGVAVISVDIERVNAKYENMALSVSLLNAGVLIAGAYEAGKHEEVAVRALGIAPGEEWLMTTGADPRRECPIGSFVFGTKPKQRKARAMEER